VQKVSTKHAKDSSKDKNTGVLKGFEDKYKKKLQIKKKGGEGSILEKRAGKHWKAKCFKSHSNSRDT